MTPARLSLSRGFVLALSILFVRAAHAQGWTLTEVPGIAPNTVVLAYTNAELVYLAGASATPAIVRRTAAGDEVVFPNTEPLPGNQGLAKIVSAASDGDGAILFVATDAATNYPPIRSGVYLARPGIPIQVVADQASINPESGQPFGDGAAFSLPGFAQQSIVFGAGPPIDPFGPGLPTAAFRWQAGALSVVAPAAMSPSGDFVELVHVDATRALFTTRTGVSASLWSVTTSGAVPLIDGKATQVPGLLSYTWFEHVSVVRPFGDRIVFFGEPYGFRRGAYELRGAQLSVVADGLTLVPGCGQQPFLFIGGSSFGGNDLTLQASEGLVAFNAYTEGFPCGNTDGVWARTGASLRKVVASRDVVGGKRVTVASVVGIDGQTLLLRVDFVASPQRLVVATLEQSTDVRWTDPFGGAFTDAANWEGQRIPSSADRAVFDLPSSVYPVFLFGDVVTDGLLVRDGTVTLSCFAASLGLEGLTLAPGVPSLVVGDTPARDARLTVRNTGGALDGLLARDALLASAPGSFANVTVSGSTGPTFLDATGDVVVGGAGSASLTLQLSARSDIAGSLSLGRDASSSGYVLLDGFDSQMRYGVESDMAPASVVVGDAGSGHIEVREQAVLRGESVDTVTLGSAPSGLGAVELHGSGSRWIAKQRNLIIGDQGTGTIDVSGGATLTTTTSEQIILGREPGSVGRVEIDQTSSWTETNPAAFLQIGGDGEGLLALEHSATVSVPNVVIRPSGTLASRDGGSLIVGDVTNLGLISPGDGDRGVLTIAGALRQVAAPPGALPTEAGRIRLILRAGSAGYSDQVDAYSMELGGALILDFEDESVRPSQGESLGYLLTGAISGAFDVVLLPGFSDTRYVRVVGTSAPESGDGFGAIAGFVDAFGFPLDLGNSQNFSAPGLPTAAGAGDLNGDGLADVALTLTGESPSDPGSVVVLFSAGTTGGVFNGFTSGVQIPAGVQPSAITLANLTHPSGSSVLDLAVTNRGGDSVSILSNNGAGVFTPTGLLTGGLSAPVAITASDLNRDGLVDLVVANEADDSVKVFANGGLADVNFLHGPQIHFMNGSQPSSTGAGDLENDKDEDVVVTLADAGQVAVLKNITPSIGALPQFAAPALFTVGPRPLQVRVRDLHEGAPTGSGLSGPEIITISSLGSVSILRNLDDGEPHFAPSVEVPVGDDASSVTALDLDNDLDIDLAVVSTPPGGASPTVRILKNELNAGTQLAFAEPSDFPTGSQPLFVESGDLDGNLSPDLITVSAEPVVAALRVVAAARRAGSTNADGASPDEVSVRLNPTSFRPGDTNNDGLVDFLDLNNILSDYGGSPPMTERRTDLNRDGVVDFLDLNIVLSFFGTTP